MEEVRPAHLRRPAQELGWATPDPTIPAPPNLQAFNRYSYVYNNPLAFIDPAGLTPAAVAAASSGVTAEELNAANKASADNTSAGAIGNSGLAKFDGLSTVPNIGGGGRSMPDKPVYDEYGNVTGFRPAEGGELTDANDLSKNDVERMVSDYKDSQDEKDERAKNADKEKFSKGDNTDVDDGSSSEEATNSGEGNFGNGARTAAAKKTQGDKTEKVHPAHQEFLDKLHKVFEGSKIGGGVGVAGKVKIGPIKIEGGIEDIQGNEVTADGIEPFAKDGPHISIQVLSAVVSIDEQGKVSASLSAGDVSVDSWTTISVGGTVTHPYTGAAVHATLQVNFSELFKK